MHDINKVFPFAAVVGQEYIKKTLIWNIINPDIGGVLISGEKGTAKSTLVRGLCSIAYPQKLIELPLNATEDMVSGCIDFEHVVKHGERQFQKGILQKVNGNILYIDEVNLLSDHIGRILLESASTGMNIVEREGISYCHQSKFILIGSMNPEEGGLRPQFLDRFGLYVEVKGETDIRKRIEVVKRRLEYEKDPEAYQKKWKEISEQLILRIKQARAALSDVVVTQNAMQIASVIAMDANCEGHRAEIAMIETAKAIAAWDLRVSLNIDDIKEAAKFVLPHRMRQQQNQQSNESSPPKPDESDKNEPEQDISDQDTSEQLHESSENRSNDIGENEPEIEAPLQEHDKDQSDNTESKDQKDQDLDVQETIADFGEPFAVTSWLSDKGRCSVGKGNGKRSIVKTSSNQGRYVRCRYPVNGKIRDIAIDATIRVAAPYQLCRNKNGLALAIEKSDIRTKVREKRTGNTILFVVDASGSMGASKRMKSVKGAILSLLNDAYQKRDKVGLIVFRKQSAQLLLGITRSVDLAKKELVSLPTGGRTPLAAGLEMAYEVIKAAKVKDKDLLPVIVLVSDGKATYSEKGINPVEDAMCSAKKIASEKIKAVVVDANQGFINLHLSEKLAEAMYADCFKIDDLHAQNLVSVVKMALEKQL